jgi:hypothetical protein
MFISFACPEEMNQRKGHRNRAEKVPRVANTRQQMRVRRRQMPTPAKTGACYTNLYALPFWLQFAPFPGLPSHVNLKETGFITIFSIVY